MNPILPGGPVPPPNPDSSAGETKKYSDIPLRDILRPDIVSKLTEKAAQVSPKELIEWRDGKITPEDLHLDANDIRSLKDTLQDYDVSGPEAGAVGTLGISCCCCTCCPCCSCG